MIGTLFNCSRQGACWQGVCCLLHPRHSGGDALLLLHCLHFSGVKHPNWNGLNVQPVSKLLDHERVTLRNTRRRINAQNNMVLSDLHSAVPSLPPQHHVCLTGCLGEPLTWSRAPDKLVGQPLCHFHFITGFDFAQPSHMSMVGEGTRGFPPFCTKL